MHCVIFSGWSLTTKAIWAYNLFYLYVIPEMSILFTWHVSSLPFLISSVCVIAFLNRNNGHSVRSCSNCFYCIVLIFLFFFFLPVYFVGSLNRLRHQLSSYNVYLTQKTVYGLNFVRKCGSPFVVNYYYF